ncbi:MAG: hypothetical protein ABIH11_03210 [Candidatus Altiarchaeota archaeon]
MVSSVDEVERRLNAESGSSRGFGEFTVDKTYRIAGVGTIIVGEVVSGMIEPGYKCVHNGITYVAKSMEKHHDVLEHAYPGDKIGINIKAEGGQESDGPRVNLFSILKEIFSTDFTEKQVLIKTGELLRFEK